MNLPFGFNTFYYPVKNFLRWWGILGVLSSIDHQNAIYVVLFKFRSSRTFEAFKQGDIVQKAVVLIAANDAALSQDLKEPLSRHGYEIIAVGNHAHLLQTVRTERPDLIILGGWTNSADQGLEEAQEIRARDKTIPLILIANNSSEDLAIAALRAGINDYFKKPFSSEELAASVERCLGASRPWPSSARIETTAGELASCAGLIGKSSQMLSIKAYLLKIAMTDSTVFITGETGTGKELVAELIHRHSLGSAKPFVCVNCAALSDSLLESELFGHERGAFTGAIASQQGKFEVAGGGTIFLDEIGEMNIGAQAKILRAIENKEIYRVGGGKKIPLNVRVIAATNQDPEQLVTEEKFRKDLYFRLNVARIHLPPLRDRKEDIPLLLEHYVREMNRRLGQTVEGFTEETLAGLLRYDWSGNVRELKNLCEAIFINLPSRMIAFADLPEPYQRRLQEAEGLSQSERDRLLSALFSTNWNVSKASQKLHWSRMTLYRKISKYHINKTCKPEISTAP